jgi:DNA sulfur modification protein DndD
MLRARRRIEDEVEGEQWLTASSFIRKRVDERLSELAQINNGSKGESLDPVVASMVRAIIEGALVPPSSLQNSGNLNQFSARDAAKVLGWFEEASSRSSAEVRNLATRHRELSLQQQDVIQRLAKAPSEAQLAPLITEFNALHTRLSELKAQLATLDTDLARLDREIDSVNRTIDRLREEAYHQERASMTLGTARKIGNVLREFQTALTEARIAEVTHTLQETFSSLSRKRGWLGGIRVDPKSFSVSLVDKNGRELPKERLAAGEKQIYAVALLWALAKASGRSLPFIIDTPLGRLDSSHRRNLVTSFLPVASEQVIVFSTDTEIDRPYFASLSPHIARTYHLVHDEGLGLTRFESGYFWRPDSSAEAT